MKIIKYNLIKEKLDKLHADERLFFIQILNFLNDLNVFSKLLTFSASQEKGEDKIQSDGQLAMTINILLSLIGVINEGWSLIDRATAKKILRKYRPLKELYLENFEIHFGKNGGLRKIRNKFINHYDPNLIEEYYQNSDINDFDLFFSDNFGFNFSSIHTLISVSIFHELGFDPEKKGLEACFGESFDLVLKYSSNLQKFIVEYFVIFIKEYFHEDLKDISPLELENLPKLDDVNIPFLFE